MNFIKTFTIFILVGVLSFIVGFTFKNQAILPQTSAIVSNTSGNPLSSPKIQEAYSYLERYFYGFDSKTATEKEDALIDALAKSLGDKHTSYFNPKDAKEFSESLSGDFEGIGAVIQAHLKGIQIMKVLKESPAMKSGLQKGDIITKVNNTSTVGMTAEDAVEIIRGPKGSIVKLTVLSGDQEKEVDITRDQVMVPSVSLDILSGTTLGYIEIGFFGEHTTSEFSIAIKELTQSGVTGLIIDGRNNGGGYLSAATDVLSMLLPPNQLAVETRGIDPQENVEYMTEKNGNTNTTIPVVMLVNSLSASATEITAGALQDYNRALIIGEKTYGKGSVQEPFILSDGSMMKITVAKWFTPKNRMIDKEGIIPDVTIDLTDEDYQTGNDRQLKGAEILLQEMVKNNLSVAEYKKDISAIQGLLELQKILP